MEFLFKLGEVIGVALAVGLVLGLIVRSRGWER